MTALLGPLLALAFVLALRGCKEDASPKPPEEVPATREGSGDEAAKDDDEPAQPAPWVIDVDADPYVTYDVVHPRDAEEPAWKWRAETKTLRILWDEDRPRAEQVEAMSSMLAHLIEQRDVDLEQAMLSLRIAYPHYSEFSERIARHAASDRAWRRLRPELQQSGLWAVPGRRVHDYIVQATRGHGFHEELDRIFEPFGVRPRLESVEKCVVVWPSPRGHGKSRFHPELSRWLAEQDIRVRGPLPVGCGGSFELVTLGAPTDGG